MVQINWGILNPNGPGPGERFQHGFEQGREQARQNALQEALRGLAENPDDERSMGTLIQADPQLGMRFQERRQQQAQQMLERRRDDIRGMAQIIRQINPRDTASWQQGLALARQMGLNVEGAPTEFDPGYAQGLVSIADAFDPQGNEGFTLSPGQVRYGRNGQEVARGPAPAPNYIPLPPGGRLVLEPGTGGPVGDDIPDGTVIENDAGQRMVRQGGQWVSEGGAGSQAPAPFNPATIDANFTSGRRTPEGNRLVGGVPNSAHLRGDAGDFTPRNGESMSQLAARLRRQFPNARVINEGDHVHVEQRGMNAPYHGRRGTTGLRGP